MSADELTMHSFCRRVLHDHPFEAGVDPRFSIIGVSNQRALAGPLLDELIEARMDEPIIRQLTEAMDAEDLRDAIFSFYRRSRQSEVTLAQPNDPAPFLEAFTRCYAEMLALNESPDDSLGPLIEATKPDLKRVMEWAARMSGKEFDWKAFQLIRDFRWQFKPQAGNDETSRLIQATRDALTGFLDACLDRESARWSEALMDLLADFDTAYASAKDELGVLDFDDLLIKTDQLLEKHPQIAQRYPNMPADAACPTEIRAVADNLRNVPCGLEIVCLPESYTSEERHDTQAEFIAQRITELTSEGVALDDIGIVVRSAYNAHHYERKLAEYGVEHCFIGSRPLCEAPEIQQIVSLLEAVDHPPQGMIHRLADRHLTMPGGRQRYANVRKFFDLVEDHDLAQIKEMEITQVQTAERGVRIMPMHSARQMPTVFVADISHSLDLKPRLFALDPDYGLAVWVVNPKTGHFVIPLMHREIGEVVREKQIPREQEMLRKALTFGQDRLILVGCSNLRGDKGLGYRRIYSWSGWIEKALGLGPATPEGENDANGCRFTLRTDPPRSMRPSDLPNTLANQYAAEFREGRPIPSAPSSAIASDAVARCLIPLPPIAPVVKRISVSQALDYLECPARYRMLHIIGMPEEGGEPPDDLEEAEVSAADLGHQVHDLLSRLDFSQDIRPQVQGHPLLERFAGSRWVAELRSADKILKEVPFEVPLAGKILAGRMDVLYHGPNGWVVLDYKTGRAETRERYELQVGIYAHVTHRLMGEMPAQAALVLLSTGEDWVQDASDGSVAEMASDKLIEVCSAIDSGDFHPTPCKACAWCSFKAQCNP